ncbi:unnamed protein product [Mytilus edulis]|uniref:Uncharacterized protein n=1 Tax=Mytilus edulis TaxID=6550 RepID=A0A8S3RPW0_MYTED|nr:unnamed protein product [Mytilus edulis]
MEIVKNTLTSLKTDVDNLCGYNISGDKCGYLRPKSECNSPKFERKKRMRSIVVVGLLILAMSTNLVLPCPNSCLCITQYERVIVHCNGTGLADIPGNIPNDAYAVHMDKKPITIIENGTFQNMTSLDTLNFSLCNISSIETGAFRNLPNLRELYLSKNRITSLHQGTFKDLSALTRLELSNNRITTLQNGIFKDLRALVDLSLRGNNLTFVQNDTFEYNINLKFL